MIERFLVCLVFLGIVGAGVRAQQPSNNSGQDREGTRSGATSAKPQGGAASVGGTQSTLRKGNPAEVAPEIRIGPGDELDITVFGFPELSQHLRVSNSGDVSLPLTGTVHLAGLSSDEAEALVEKRLADGHFVNNPHVSVYVKEYTAEGISLIGEVGHPGVYPAVGAHRLMDLIQMAGGLTEKAGKTVTVSHRDGAQNPLTLTLFEDAVKMAQNNIDLLPGDTVVVSKAGIVYIVGEVNRPGGFVIEGNHLMASEALAMAAGPTRMASLNRARIIRRTPDGLKETPLPLSKVLDAKSPDVALQANDIVYVPESHIKGAISAGNVVSLLASAAIYRF
jgi:polysaccharide biosynthesis/export protein